MVRFEDRLARHLTTLTALTLLATACQSCGSEAGPASLERMCDGKAGPAEHVLLDGYTTVEVGTECPDPSEAQITDGGCNDISWAGVTCAFDHVEENQVKVDDGYGGYFVNAEDAPTEADTGVSIGAPVDICHYEGVFHDPPGNLTCGRPLLQAGEPQLARTRSGDSDWTRPLPSPTDLDATERAHVGDWWLQAARMEHASVASFSVCSLDLMRFGAPPDLLAATHRAALDEIEHARICFALASRYHAADLGPAPMPTLHPSAATTLADFAEALFREGCIGETLAAVDAAARLALARDPVVREALQTIVTDESEHAALAWRTLGWLLTQDTDGQIQTRLAAILDEETQRWTAPSPSTPPPAAAVAHGLLDAETRARTLARALDNVVRPSWEVLVAPSGTWVTRPTQPS